ncbi:MAG: helix-turn-helix domain-containing protein, partial [Acutalibacteraceae bacterium]
SPDGTIRLPNKEYQMMEMFMLSPSQIIPTERFIEKIWGYDFDSEINVVWVYISNLRKKLADLNAGAAIKASRNIGYILEEEND